MEAVIKGLLNPDPKKRLTLSQALTMPFFQEMDVQFASEHEQAAAFEQLKQMGIKENAFDPNNSNEQQNEKHYTILSSSVYSGTSSALSIRSTGTNKSSFFNSSSSVRSPADLRMENDKVSDSYTVSPVFAEDANDSSTEHNTVEMVGISNNKAQPQAQITTGTQSIVTGQAQLAAENSGIFVRSNSSIHKPSTSASSKSGNEEQISPVNTLQLGPVLRSV